MMVGSRVVGLFLVLAISALFAADAKAELSLAESIKVGTKIKGDFKFTEGPSQGAIGTWELDIQQRQDKMFQAEYRAKWTPEIPGHELICSVTGEVSGNNMDFTIDTDNAKAKVRVVDVANGEMKLRFVGGGGRVAEMSAKLPPVDPFAAGSVWAGDFKVALAGQPIRKWVLTVTQRRGKDFKGNILVKDRDGVAPDKANGAIVCQSERKGLAQVKLTGKLQDGEAVLVFSGINALGIPGAGTATLKPLN
jgi:hypothetical protein